MTSIPILCTVIDNRIESPLGEPLAAETREYLGPFEPDLVHTSVGKWSRSYQYCVILMQ